VFRTGRRLTLRSGFSAKWFTRGIFRNASFFQNIDDALF
jgi:hypothetical protein